MTDFDEKEQDLSHDHDQHDHSEHDPDQYHDPDADDLADDDNYDPSQPLPQSKFFGGGSNSSLKQREEEKYNDEYSGGGGNNNNPPNNNPPNNNLTSNHTLPSVPSSLPEIDALTAADSLPAFANTDVRVLDSTVKAKEKLLQKYIDEEEENKERVGVMNEHLKNVRSERLHSQQLLDAKDRAIQTESHLKQLAEREAGRVQTDVTKLEKFLHDTQDKLNSIQNNHFLATETLESFKQQMNWNQEELLQWSLAAKQKDEDRAALQKYTKADETKLKHLILKNENMTRIEQEKRTQLAHEVTETQAIQIELDKTSEEYRKLHLSKQELIKQWDESELTMQKRDAQIMQVSEQIARGKNELRARENLVNEQKTFLESESQNNKQLNISIGMYERVAEKTRNDLNQSKKSLIEFEDEVATQRSELEKAESELKLTKVTNQTLFEQKNEKLTKLAELNTAVGEARHALNTEYLTTDNLSDRSKQVDSLYKEHTLRLTTQKKSLQLLKESMFKYSHELFEKRKVEADLIAEISGAQGTSRNLQQRIHELDQRSLKQQEMLYNIEFQVQQLERRVSHASGKRSLEDTMKLNQQIVVLQEQLGVMKGQDTILSNQVKKLSEDLRAAKRTYRERVTGRDTLIEKISRIELENESTQREMKDVTRKKEELSVSHDLLKLEVKKLREQLNVLADSVLEHENRRVQLQLSMKERENEISLHQDIQRSEVKSAEEARHSLARDLKERQIKVEKLQKKYETIAAKLSGGGVVGADGSTTSMSLDASTEEHSQAYYIIAAAQEREELQRIGDELNNSIRQCETEVAALNNTQSMLNGRNTLYRAGLQKPDPEGDDTQLKLSLEEQQRAAIEKVYKHRSYLKEITQDFEERRNILAQLLNSIGAQQSDLTNIDQQHTAFNKSLQEQHSQLQRATNSMNSRRNEYRRKFQIGENDESIDEMYMNLQEQKRKNQVMIGLLAEFSEKNQDTMQDVQGTLEELGIRMSRPTSAASSRSSSSRASSSASNSHRDRPDSAASSIVSARPMSSASSVSIASASGAFGVRGGSINGGGSVSSHGRPASGAMKKMAINGSGVQLPQIHSTGIASGRSSKASSRPQSNSSRNGAERD